MVEEVDDKNLFISVSSPNLNLNISRDSSNPLVNGNEVTDPERFYLVSMAVDVEVRIMDTCRYAGGGARNLLLVVRQDPQNRIQHYFFSRPLEGDERRRRIIQSVKQAY